jgi:hypothetical protein
MRRSYDVPITERLSLILQKYLLNAVLVTHCSLSDPFVSHGRPLAALCFRERYIGIYRCGTRTI